MTSKLKVYGRSDSSNCAKVFWLLDRLGQDYELIPAGRGHGGTAAPGFLDLTPFGKVPVIVDGDVSLWESNAILRYLAERFEATALWPKELAGRARIDRWMDWASLSLTPPLTRLRKARAAGGEGDLAAVVAAFTVLDTCLGNSKFIAGEALSLADITAGPAVYRWFLLEGERPALGNLERYAEMMAQDPQFRRYIQDSLN